MCFSREQHYVEHRDNIVRYFLTCQPIAAYKHKSVEIAISVDKDLVWVVGQVSYETDTLHSILGIVHFNDIIKGPMENAWGHGLWRAIYASNIGV